MDKRVADSLKRVPVPHSGGYHSSLVVQIPGCELLESFGLPTYKLRLCGRYAHAYCTADSTHSGLTRFRCHKKFCPVCDWIAVRSQVDDMKFVLNAIFDALKEPFFVWTIDFTVGRDLWEPIFAVGGLKKMRRVAAETLREYWDGVWRFPVNFPLDVSAQWWSTRFPGSGARPHLHCQLPRMFVEKATGRILRDVRVKYIDEDRLKKIWRRRVEEAWKPSMSVSQGKYEKFSVRINYLTGVKARFRRGLDKRLRYAYRGPAQDYERFAVNRPDWKKFILRWDRHFVVRTLTVPIRRRQGFGLFAGRAFSAKGSFMRSIGLDLGRRNERDRVRRHQECPECGARISYKLGEGATTMSEAEARVSSLPVWGSSAGDEIRKYKEYEPYHP